MVRATSPTYYHIPVVAFFQDIDFDIGDTFILSPNAAFLAFNHSHGSAHLEANDGAAWSDLEHEGAPIAPGANLWVLVPGLARTAAVNGQIRISGSAIDDSSLEVIYETPTKTAG